MYYQDLKGGTVMNLVRTQTKTSNRITNNDNSEFKRSLKSAKVEADVEQAYKRIFQKRYVDGIQNALMYRPFGSDGYLRTGDLVLSLRMLMEFKKGTTLVNISDRAKIIAQVIYYLKRFEQNGEELPNVIFSGDEKEMFVVYAPVLFHYLKEDYDWEIAPNEAHLKNIDLLTKLYDDSNLSSFVFDISTPKFHINDVLDAIDSLALNEGEFFKIRVTEVNIRMVFDEFIRMIFSDQRKVKLGVNPEEDPHLLVSIFIQALLGDKHLYPIPDTKNKLHLPNNSIVTLDTTAFSAFFSRYERRYTLEEKDRLTAISDQLIEETARRFSGDFWTPTIWANRAHEMITEVVGDNWRNEFVVWDCASGAKNLTRDFQFSNLFSSTLHQEELDIGKHYNKESESFQYDFLNDDVHINQNSNPNEIKMPIKLFEALKNDEPIVFFTNPPYGTANEAGASGKSKAEMAKTEINAVMKENKVGSASQQLYAQFFCRILKLKNDFNLTNIYIAFFSKTQFFTGGRYWEKFENQLFSEFEFQKGLLFNAGEFSDVSDMWAVNFSIFKQRDSTKKEYPKEFQFSVEETEIDGIKKIGKKTITTVPQRQLLSTWVREPNSKRRDFREMPYPQFSSIFNVNEGKNYSGRLLSNSIGYMVNVASNVYKSQRDVFILSGSAYMGHGLAVTPENIERVAVTFASRKSIKHSWINDMDNFKRPELESIEPQIWNEFVNDCLIYSLFNINASYQGSFSNVSYHDKLYNIDNEWFFMSYEEIKELAQKFYLNEIEEQLRFVNKERFVYEKIQGITLSDDAENLYKQAIHLVKSSFEHRSIANQSHPEWHVMNWDAGFYQIYKMIDTYKIDGLNEFKELFEILEIKIEQRVYDFGMLSR